VGEGRKEADERNKEAHDKGARRLEEEGERKEADKRNGVKKWRETRGKSPQRGKEWREGAEKLQRFCGLWFVMEEVSEGGGSQSREAGRLGVERSHRKKKLEGESRDPHRERKELCVPSSKPSGARDNGPF